VGLAPAADDLTISGTWSTIALVANSDVDPGDSGVNRTVTIVPATGLYEMTVITTSASDGTATTEAGKGVA
jgi:hypothetical protein